MEIKRILGANEDHSQLVKSITDACNQADGTQYPYGDGSDFRKEGDANLFFAYRGEKVAGYLRMFTPGKSEGEITVLVRPEHRRYRVFKTLMEEGRRELARRLVPSLLLVCDVRSPSGIMAAESYGAKYEFSEFMMRHSGTTRITPIKTATKVAVQPANPSDSSRLLKIMQEAFNDDESDATVRLNGFFQDERRHIFRILNGDQIVGMIGVYDEGEAAYIHGFAVSREYRGMGIGRLALNSLVGMISSDRPGCRIILEVQTENEDALGLYESVGFIKSAEFRYYRRTI